MFEDELIIFDTSINFIDKEHWGYNFLKVEDLFYTYKYKYLKNYYFAKPGKSAYQYWFDIIKTFDNEDIKVEVIDKNEVFKDVLFKECYEIYKNSNEILRITKCL